MGQRRPRRRRAHEQVQHHQIGDQPEPALHLRRADHRDDAQHIGRRRDQQHRLVGEAVGQRAPVAQRHQVGDLADDAQHHDEGHVVAELLDDEDREERRRQVDRELPAGQEHRQPPEIQIGHAGAFRGVGS